MRNPRQRPSSLKRNSQKQSNFSSFQPSTLYSTCQRNAQLTQFIRLILINNCKRLILMYFNFVVIFHHFVNFIHLNQSIFFGHSYIIDLKVFIDQATAPDSEMSSLTWILQQYAMVTVTEYIFTLNIVVNLKHFYQ